VNDVETNYETKADEEHWRERDPEEMSEYQLIKSIHDSQREFTATENRLRKRLRAESAHPTLPVNENLLASDIGVRWIRKEGKDVIRIPWIYIEPHLKKRRRKKKSARQRKIEEKSSRENLLNSSVTDCAVCRGQLGLVICCDTCPRMYHPECLFPKVENPDLLPEFWQCHVCLAQTE